MTLLYASTVWAETFTVTNLNDSGPGSLREAIDKANARAGADQIVFADGVSGTITLGSTLPTVADPEGLVIDGGGDVRVIGNDAGAIDVVGQGVALTIRRMGFSASNSDVFGRSIISAWQGTTVEVIDCTFSGANSSGAVDTVEGTLAVIDSTISDNIYGGLGNFGGTLKVVNSTISGNGASGIYADLGTTEVIDSTVSANGNSEFVGRGGQGGGIENRGGALKVTGSTISDNSSYRGGGIFNDAVCCDDTGGGWWVGTVEVTGSTISGNSAVERGGGILTASRTGNDRTLVLTNSTISGNSADPEYQGGGIVINSGTATLRSTIVANSTSGGNCFALELGGVITDAGYNVEDANTCGFTQDAGSLPNTNPLLDPEGLQDNGGPTPTIALLPESPAVDLVGQDACPPPSTDQRGVERPQGEACDAGAFELVQGPQTKADCKKGGWEEFGFKNQGQCIASLQKKQSTNG